MNGRTNMLRCRLGTDLDVTTRREACLLVSIEQLYIGFNLNRSLRHRATNDGPRPVDSFKRIELNEKKIEKIITRIAPLTPLLTENCQNF